MKNILGRRTKSPLVRRPILFNTCVNIPMSSQLLAVYCPRKIHILRLPGTPDGLKDRPLFTEQGRGDDAVRIYETRKDILILGGYRRIDTIAQQSSRLDAV